MKYKLIKEYPGSPKLGYEAKKGEFSFMDEFSEYWEKIKGKEYEILSFSSHYSNKLIKKYNNGLFGIIYGQFSEEDQLYKMKMGQPNKKIHSIKRLSDGEVFTVGDRVSATDNFYTGGIYHQNKISKIASGWWASKYYNISINNFKLVENEMCIIYEPGNNGMGQPIELVMKLVKPLFTTEDGVDIFKGDKVWGITQKVWEPFSTSESASVQKWEHGVFSTEEAAKDYILMNKPCLSVKDVMGAGYGVYCASPLIRIVKSKL